MVSKKLIYLLFFYKPKQKTAKFNYLLQKPQQCVCLANKQQQQFIDNLNHHQQPQS